MSSESIVLHGVVRTHEVLAIATDLLALPSCVTEGNSRHVYVGVGIGPHQVKEACQTTA